MSELVSELVNLESPGKDFYFQNQKVLLTYKTHINKDMFAQMMYIRSDKIKKCYIAHENGVGDTITPYEHTHAVIDFGKRVQSKDARFLDIDGIHPHISIIKNVAQWKKACKYICKEDKTVVLQEDDRFSDGIDLDKIWNCNDLRGALETCENLRDVVPTMMLYDRKPMVWGREINCAIKSEEDMFPWQRNMWECIHGKCDNRSIHWISDNKGCKGKTQFIIYCGLTVPGKVMWIVPNGTSRDIMHVVMEQIKAGWRGDTILINLSRSATSCSDMTQVYRVMEDLKDGLIYSSKYMGGTLMIPSPHIIVLSNTTPDLHRLSLDRWRLYEIGEEKTLTPVTLKIGGSGEMHSPSGYNF